MFQTHTSGNGGKLVKLQYLIKCVLNYMLNSFYIIWPPSAHVQNVFITHYAHVHLVVMLCKMNYTFNAWIWEILSSVSW